MTTAKELCDHLAAHYSSQDDGRSQNLAGTLAQLGDALGSEHSAEALYGFWAHGQNAMGTHENRKKTLAELVSATRASDVLCPKTATAYAMWPNADAVARMRAVGEALIAYLQPLVDSGDPRATSMVATFRAETDVFVD